MSSSSGIVYDTAADSLRRNDGYADGTTLDLDSAVDLEDLDDLIDAIHRNTTIVTLQLEGHVICSLTPDSGRRFFDALGGLPSLKHFYLNNYTAPLPLLTGFLVQAKTIENISLKNAQLAGRTAQEGDEFATAIGSLPCLEGVKFCNVVFAGGFSLEKLGMALSGIWGLQNVFLEMESGGTFPTGALGALCRCPNLRELRLWRMTFHPEHLMLIANSVQRNHTIKQLELGDTGFSDHTAESYRAVAEMLRNNKCLKNFGMINFDGLDDEGCIAMANALEENSTLKEITLRGCHNHVMNAPAAKAVAQMFSRNTSLEGWCMNSVGVDDDGAVAIARALERDNSTLKSLILQRIVGDKTRAFDALMEMLETNLTLERVYPEATGEVKRQLDFLLGLNQVHIRNLQLDVDTNRTEFLNILIANRHELNRAFYLLSSNPDFLHLR